MKKIAIITFHRAHNYGAVLQSYALKRAINSIDGCDAEIVDYLNVEWAGWHRKLIDLTFIKHIMKSFFLFPFFKRKNRVFSNFINAYLVGESQKKYDSKIIIEYGDADLFIAGSDQIWNHAIKGSDNTYFLNFVAEKSKKYSYAASFGDEEGFYANEGECISHLSTFAEVSLREPIGYRELTKQIGKPHVHIDPTLLLSAGEWRDFAKNREMGEKYILFYTVFPPDKLGEYAKFLSRQLKLKVLVLPAGARSLLKKPFCKKIPVASPCEFVSIIANAEYVFTTSFHGVAFSILFRRKFFTELKNKGKLNCRVDNLLKLFELKDRAIEYFNGDFNKGIDWEAVEAKLSDERKKSFDYLERICGSSVLS